MYNLYFKKDKFTAPRSRTQWMCKFPKFQPDTIDNETMNAASPEHCCRVQIVEQQAVLNSLEQQNTLG